MKRTEEFIWNRLNWKVDKYDFPRRFSCRYEDLSDDKKHNLNIDTDTAGNPVLYFTKPTIEWTLICTKQVICYDNREFIAIDLEDIDKLLPTTFGTNTVNPSLINRESKLSKMEYDQLKVYTRLGKQFILHTDKGTDLFTLWNILQMITRILS
jgi:hypothetical protein